MQQQTGQGPLARTARRLAQARLLGFASAAGTPKLVSPKVGNKPAIGTDLRRVATPKVGNKPEVRPALPATR